MVDSPIRQAKPNKLNKAWEGPHLTLNYINQVKRPLLLIRQSQFAAVSNGAMVSGNEAFPSLTLPIFKF